MKDVNDLCWETGHYSDKCDCNTCIHRDECSGSNADDE